MDTKTTLPKVLTFGFMNAEITVKSMRAHCLSFWDHHRTEFNKLLHPAARALSVPASSSPVERVFSHGGIILYPHRARMSNILLSKLIFLKCNSLLK